MVGGEGSDVSIFSSPYSLQAIMGRGVFGSIERFMERDWERDSNVWFYLNRVQASFYKIYHQGDLATQFSHVALLEYLVVSFSICLY